MLDIRRARNSRAVSAAQLATAKTLTAGTRRVSSGINLEPQPSIARHGHGCLVFGSLDAGRVVDPFRLYCRIRAHGLGFPSAANRGKGRAPNRSQQ
jgi:hypothetical protein